MKDWKQKIRDWENYKNETGLDNEEFYPSIDFDLLVNFIEQIISERDKEILKEFVDYLIIPTEYPDTGITANKITYDGIKWRFEKFLQTLNK